MINNLLDQLKSRKTIGQKSIAVLVDPDKVTSEKDLLYLIRIANENYVDFFFIGGSLLTNDSLSEVIQVIKSNSTIPVVLFPGSNLQIDASADGILLLSLISGRNSELLIGQHVVAAPMLKKSGLEIIPTGYMLVDGGNKTTVAYMSNTTPIPADKPSVAACTALAGEMLGMQLIYMDAGSGAKVPINSKMIRSVQKSIECPLIVGGGIDSVEKALATISAGTDVIVIGNAIEKDPNLLIEVSTKIYDMNKALNIH